MNFIMFNEEEVKKLFKYSEAGIRDIHKYGIKRNEELKWLNTLKLKYNHLL